MAQPYIGEIRMFAGTFAPAGWAFCDGQLLAISENDALFTLIGTTYGGDGESTFALPDLRGRIPIHLGTLNGQSYVLGESAGTEEVTLTSQQMPIHSHVFLASTDLGSSPDPQGAVLATSRTAGVDLYIEDDAIAAMNNNAVLPEGGSQPHTNFQPYLCLNFILSLYGIFPPPS